nr:transcription initiation factor tfiid subunit 13 [Quercus suber]
MPLAETGKPCYLHWIGILCDLNVVDGACTNFAALVGDIVEYVTDLDLPKLNRCTELLSMNKELKQVRKVFESDEEKLRKVFEADEEN